MEEKSYVSGLLIIAAGILVFFLLFLFAKRQISRFKFKSSRLHINIGSKAPKVLKQEIVRRLNEVAKIKWEPKLLDDRHRSGVLTGPSQTYYRMKAVDSFKKLDEMLIDQYDTHRGHQPNTTVRQYLLSLYPMHLSFSSSELIHQFSDAYEHARHDPEEFGEAEYLNYVGLLDELITCVKLSGKAPDKRMETEVIYRPNRSGSGSCETKPVHGLFDNDQSESIEMKPMSPSSPDLDSGLSSKHSSLDQTLSITFNDSAEQLGLLDTDKG